MTDQTVPVFSPEAVAIAEGESASNAILVGNRRLFELQIGDAALDGSLGIQTAVSEDGDWKWARVANSDFGDTKNTIYRIETPLADSSYPLPPDLCVAAWMRFKSFTGDATAASPTDQTQSAARSMVLITKS